MGFSHYWRRKKDFTRKQWESISLEAFDILSHCEGKGIVIAKDYDVPADAEGKPTPPEVTPDQIWFNGWKEEGHETFVVTRDKPDNGPSWDKDAGFFDFCKTARKPYDLAVCMVLLSMKRHAPKIVNLSSDGDWDGEWTEARRAYKDLFGVEAKCPWGRKKVSI